MFFLVGVVVLSSCVRQSTGYRVVGKNGRVLYFEKKRPDFNAKQLKNKEMQEINSKSKNTTQTTSDIKPVSRIKEDFAQESSAYTLKSVVDTMVKDEDVGYLTKNIEKNKKPKTIKDFDIPEYYFSNDTPKTNVVASGTVQINNAVVKKPGKMALGNFLSTFTNKVSRINRKKKEEKQEIMGNDSISARVVKENPLLKFFTRKKSGKKQEIDNVSVGTEDKKKVENKEEVENENKPEKENITIVKATFNDNQQLGKNNNVLGSSNPKVKGPKISALIKNKYYIQVGSFTNAEKAQQLINNFVDIGSKQGVVPVISQNKQMYRAVVGEFNSRPEAEKEMEKVLERGHFDAYVFKK
jgi:cell division protein FtsN